MSGNNAKCVGIVMSRYIEFDFLCVLEFVVAVIDFDA